jgi:hypothetical protein
VLAVTAAAARQLKPPVAARLPVALATMHLAWGAGFLTSPRRLVPHGRAGGAEASVRASSPYGAGAGAIPGSGAPEPAGLAVPPVPSPSPAAGELDHGKIAHIPR